MNDVDDDNQEGWTVVTARDKKRVMRKRGVRRRIPPLSTSQTTNSKMAGGTHCGDHSTHSAANASASASATANRLDTIESIDECVKECIQYLCRPTTDQGLWRTTIGTLHDSFPDIDEIVCFGIGNFSKGRPTYLEAPLWQLSFALALRDELQCAKITYYDPVTLPLEKEYLRQQQQLTVLDTNHRGRYKPEGRALYFLPHCPRRLYENILHENWGGNVDLCLIGNSLERLVESCDFMPCTRLLLPYCTTTRLRSTKNELRRAPGNLEGAFNDTYLCQIMAQSVPWSELECPIKGHAEEENNIDCELV
jgi:hypothetical protein